MCARMNGVSMVCRWRSIIIVIALLMQCNLSTGEKFQSFISNGQAVATQTGLPTFAVLPAEAPTLPFPAEKPSHLPRGFEKYLEQIVALERRSNASLDVKSQQPSLFPAQAPAIQPAERYEVAYSEIRNLQVTSHANGSFTGSGTLIFFGANGTFLTQIPIAAPLVPRSSLEDKRDLMLFTSASSAAIEFINATVPTVWLALPRSWCNNYIEHANPCFCLNIHAWWANQLHACCSFW